MSYGGWTRLPGSPHEWRFPALEAPVATMALEADGQRVAYVTQGTSSDMTASLWFTSGRPSAPHQVSKPEAVWVAPVEGAGPPQRVFELPPASGPVASGDPERIVELVWTPDGARLVAITRQAGPPARARRSEASGRR